MIIVAFCEHLIVLIARDKVVQPIDGLLKLCTVICEVLNFACHLICAPFGTLRAPSYYLNVCEHFW